MYGIDKWKAHRKQWRISEKMLLFLAVIGGSAGALAGMYIFHHKTLHKKPGNADYDKAFFQKDTWS